MSLKIIIILVAFFLVTSSLAADVRNRTKTDPWWECNRCMIDWCEIVYPPTTPPVYSTTACPEYPTPEPCPTRPDITCGPCECPTTPTTTTTTTEPPPTCPPCTTPPPEPTTTSAPCPSFEDNPSFTKSIYQSSLPTWPIAGTTVRLGIHANTSDAAPVRYELLTSFEFLTLTTEQSIIFTSNVGEGAFVGPNNVMVIEVIASVIGSEERRGSAAIVIVFPRSTTKKLTKDESTTDWWWTTTVEPTSTISPEFCCDYCGWWPETTTIGYTCPPPPTSLPCTMPPDPTCAVCTCPAIPSTTTRTTVRPTTCLPCPTPSIPSTTTTTCPPFLDNPTFTKAIYQSSLPTWPIAGTTVRLGIHANTSDEAPIRYELQTSFEFLALTTEQNIIFTSNVGDGAFVGPNNVMVLEIVASVIGNEERKSSSAVIIVFPRSTAAKNETSIVD